MRWAPAVLFVAGCDHLFQLDDIHPLSDAPPDLAIDARADAPIDGAPSDICLDEMFDGSSLDLTTWSPFWGTGATTPPTPTMTVANGVVQIALYQGTPSTTMAYNGADSVHSFPFSGGSVEVQLVKVPTDPAAEVQLYAMIDHMHEYLVAIQSTVMTLYVREITVQNMAMAKFDPLNDQYLRIRDGGDGKVYVDTATVLPSWTNAMSLPAPISFASLGVGFDAGTDGGGAASAQTAKLDNLIVRAPGCLH